MNSYKFFRLLRGFLLLGFCYVGMIAILIELISELIRQELMFRNKYGKDWVQEYEKYYGPISQNNTKIAVGILSLISVCVIGWWFYRRSRPKKKNNQKISRSKLR